MYPSLCVNKLDEIIISTGFKLFKLVNDVPTHFSDLSIFNFFPNNILQPTYKSWEITLMDIDSNNNICQVINRDNFVSIGKRTTPIFNLLKPEIPMKKIKGMTTSSVELGLDYILFNDIKFSNCFGHENVTLNITPAPIKNDFIQNTVGQIIGRYMRAGQTSIELPLEPNKIIFDINQSYQVDVLINSKVVLSFGSLRINSSNMRINDMGGISSDSWGNNIIFNNRVTGIGTRIFEVSSTSSAIRNNFPDNNIVTNGQNGIRLTGGGYRMNDQGDYDIKFKIPYVPDIVNVTSRTYTFRAGKNPNYLNENTSSGNPKCYDYDDCVIRWGNEPPFTDWECSGNSSQRSNHRGFCISIND